MKMSYIEIYLYLLKDHNFLIEQILDIYFLYYLYLKIQSKKHLDLSFLPIITIEIKKKKMKF